MKNITNHTNSLFLCLILCFIGPTVALPGQSSLGMDSLSRVMIPEGCSSVWGMTHSSGINFGLLGTRAGLRIYNLEDPSHPVEVFFIPGNECVWRELKTYKDFVYVVTECEDGLLIVDLRDIQNIHYAFHKEYLDADSNHYVITRSHTLFIDEKSYLYLAGSNNDYSGFVILDLSKNPENPLWVNAYRDEYYHEVFVRSDTLFGASIYFGEFVMWNIKDRRWPVRLGSHQTGGHFTHSVWREDGRPVLYTADETAGAFVESWDVSVPTQIQKLDRFRVNYPIDQFNIPHNVFYRDGYLFVSWYTEGVRVLDVRHPDNLQEVAYWDTHPQPVTGFHGVWNVYPFFESGLLLASDIENGMFVMRFNNARACFLEGKIRDKDTGWPLTNAEITLQSPLRQTTDFTNLLGDYKTGFSESSTVSVHIRKPGYIELKDSIQMIEDSVIWKDFELVPELKFKISTSVMHSGDAMAEENVRLKIWNSDFTYEAVSDQLGFLQIPEVVRGKYHLQWSKWGKLIYSVDNFFAVQDTFFEVFLKDGYEDQFNVDQGWTFIPDTLALAWQIGNFKELHPAPSNYPSADIDGDVGDVAIYTNNFSDADAAQNVMGHSYLFSPAMDLSAYSEISLDYTAWAYGGWESSVKETYLMLNDEKIPLEQIAENLTGKFNPTSHFTIDLKGKRRDQVYFVMHLWNDPDSVSYAISLKAALDGFLLTGKLNTEISDILQKDIRIFPNPFQDKLFIQNNTNLSLDSEWFNLKGQQLRKCIIPAHSLLLLNTSEIPSDLYFLQYRTSPDDKWQTVKVVKR